jgi:succinate dehydrogenase / fumarate reductase iron-sulfur subunit
MVEQMDKEGFGNCTNQYECEAVCPKSIKSEFISDLNRQYATATVKEAIG